MDTNVVPVWRSGITGKGVVISVLDDGMFKLLATKISHRSGYLSHIYRESRLQV